MIRRAELIDAYHIYKDIRFDDLREMQASSTRSPIETLKIGVNQGCSYLELSDQPCALFGCDPFLFDENIGIPWLIGTNAIQKNTREFMRLSHEFVEMWQQDYDLLFNYCDKRSETSIRWLTKLGFEFTGEEIHKILDLPLLKFQREKS